MTGYIGVSAIFSASHRDLIRAELHGHPYRATAWWPAEPQRDATALQAALAQTVKTAFDHKTLPDDLGTAEALAGAIKHLLGNMGCVAVDIARPLEGLYFEDARP